RCPHRTKAQIQHRKNQQGFTLIEVIVALTITGFLLGGLFSLVGGSKQLSWRAEDALVRAIQQRAAWNFALLDNEYADLEAILDDDYYEVRELDDIEAPDRQTQSLQYTLRALELVSEDGDVEAVATRWIRLQPGAGGL
ncbi:MAG: prepilin-type N-terminal cleavage/methylation domain-containing protein, partial [OM182 bacterium]|nr:prepilin-type N-terminal cleavage/methylation domain-containing protein [OM182 bacterium]